MVRAGRRYADTVVVTRGFACVQNDDEKSAAPRIPAEKGDDRVGRVSAVDPIEARLFGIAAIERRRLTIKAVEIANERIHTLAASIVAELIPIEAARFVPFTCLGKFAAHEDELLSGMHIHVGIERA